MTPWHTLMVPALVVACLLAAAEAFPQRYDPEPAYQPEQPHANENVAPQIESRQSYGKPQGRVKIQTYRGPNQEKIGYDYFAPWGYYLHQPEDDKPHGYH